MIKEEEVTSQPSVLKEFWEDFSENRGAVIGLSLIVVFVIIAILAPFLSPYDPSVLNPGAFKIGPIWADGGSSQYILGTDDLGRDTLSRLIYGARISIGIGMAVVIISLGIGTVLGLFSGYFGGTTDKVIMRMMDIIMAFPAILLAIVIVSVVGPGIGNAVIAVAIVAVPVFTRIVRAQVLAEKQKQYVMASKTFGASHIRIMFLEILPNCAAPLIVQASLGFSDGILNTAALGFLGLGAQPPMAEWGTMLSDARPFIESAPWLVTLPGLCILFVVLGFNLFGDGLRDALDPKLKR